MKFIGLVVDKFPLKKKNGFNLNFQFCFLSSIYIYKAGLS